MSSEEDFIEAQRLQAQRDLERLRGPECKDRIVSQAGQHVNDQSSRGTTLSVVKVRALDMLRAGRRAGR